ncbi:YkvA family protein [Phocaeicola faecicola]|uniref:YkvA family protein n=1 Tax=Phocaeicola faecicola TaxID=2739389 RepID=UPI0015E69814|nr:DUF1232 domain-containing protein [Phocaeicola faecicola]
MTTIICITILAYLIMGKNIDSLLEKVKDVDWKEKGHDLYEKLKPYAKKVGRTAAKPLLQFYFVLSDDKTTTLDRVLIYTAIIYIVSPVSLIPSAVYKLLGILDEGAAMLFVYNKIKSSITADIEMKVNQTLDEWFGCEYEIINQ